MFAFILSDLILLYLADLLWTFYQWVVGLPNAIIQFVKDVCNWFWNASLRGSFDILGKLADMASEWFGWDFKIDTAYWADMYGRINVIFPLDEAFVVLKFLFLTWWLVILFRYLGVFMFKWVFAFFKKDIFA